QRGGSRETHQRLLIRIGLIANNGHSIGTPVMKNARRAVRSPRTAAKRLDSFADKFFTIRKNNSCGQKSPAVVLRD
ncbi:MAG: hypothetical protein KJN72_14010, partial [Woeseia sp.]|nr:hypothetical protein [Woeseia sp.]